MSATTIEKTIFIKGSPQQVWAYLTDKDKLGDWYHPAKSDLKAGEDYALLSSETGKPQVWGKVLEMTPHTLLKTTFVIGPFGDKETIVTWVLEDIPGGTRVSLTHEGVSEASGDAAMHLLCALDVGWDDHLGRMRTALNAAT